MPSRPPLDRARRRPVATAAGALATPARPPAGAALPLIVTAHAEGADLVAWATANRTELDGWLARHGAVLLRGFATVGADRLAALVTAVAATPEAYVERSTPRTEVGEGIYTSTEHPPDQPIQLHNENSYRHVFPLWLVFCCRRPAATGGRTPLADCRRVLARIPDEVVAEFAERGVMYVRNFGHGLGLGWREAFATDSRGEVERYCESAGIALEWTGGDGLRTRQVRPALVRHPATGETVWFNHAAFFHPSSLPDAIREALVEQVGEHGLPTSSCFGDGASIPEQALDAVRAAYAAEAATVAWERGDVLVVDNLLAAHGREPFEGERELLVGMAMPLTHAQVAVSTAPEPVDRSARDDLKSA